MSFHTVASRRALALGTFGLFLVTATLAAESGGAPSQSKKKSGPETFRAKARVEVAATGVGDAYLTIQIDRYTPERDVQAMEKALAAGGSDAFLGALRAAPVVGSLKIGEKTFTIRWARERKTPSGRAISLVTDAPVYFVGGGVPGAKPRAGFDVAVLQLLLDPAGIGHGTMVAAARVKPGGETGVEVEDYAAEPLKLSYVSRVIS